jgi:hypothetical protein
MSIVGPPVCEFTKMAPCTMTIIATYNVGELNLPGLFAFLPVTEKSLPADLNFQKKQGKIKLPPELNTPGEILSMRYNKQVRGIVRSEIAKSFSHSIIIDIGTSERIISVKLSRTLELTGPTSFKIAHEAIENLLNHVKTCQDNLVFLRTNRELAIQMKYKFLHVISGGELDLSKMDEKETRIWEIYRKQTKGYTIDKISDFLDFMIDFNRNLYTGTLEIIDMDSEMINILFNLGYSINQVVFANIMNNSPFVCKFTNAKSASAVNVFYYYNKIDRNTGQSKVARHTIRVNKSGHVRHSGPNLEAMEGVYYAFMQRIIKHHKQIQSIENRKQQLKIIGTGKSISINEWKDILNKEESFRQKILNNEVPIAGVNEINECIQEEYKIIDLQVIQIEYQLSINDVIDNHINISSIDQPSLKFDYAPLLPR